MNLVCFAACFSDVARCCCRHLISRDFFLGGVCVNLVQVWLQSLRAAGFSSISSFWFLFPFFFQTFACHLASRARAGLLPFCILKCAECTEETGHLYIGVVCLQWKVHVVAVVATSTLHPPLPDCVLHVSVWWLGLVCVVLFSPYTVWAQDRKILLFNSPSTGSHSCLYHGQFVTSEPKSGCF